MRATGVLMCTRCRNSIPANSLVIYGPDYQFQYQHLACLEPIILFASAPDGNYNLITGWTHLNGDEQQHVKREFDTLMANTEQLIARHNEQVQRLVLQQQRQPPMPIPMHPMAILPMFVQQAANPFLMQQHNATHLNTTLPAAAPAAATFTHSLAPASLAPVKGRKAALAARAMAARLEQLKAGLAELTNAGVFAVGGSIALDDAQPLQLLV